jgi:hypothetical protein
MAQPAPSGSVRDQGSFAQSDQGPATITVCWPKGATDADALEVSYQVKGVKKQQATALGWAAALQTYRPLLSYDDLGQLLTAKPSELHASITRALALDELHEAIGLLKSRIDPLTGALKHANQERVRLRKEFWPR